MEAGLRGGLGQIFNCSNQASSLSDVGLFLDTAAEFFSALTFICENSFMLSSADGFSEVGLSFHNKSPL